MNANSQDYFQGVPNASIQRSTFNQAHNVLDTANFGEIIPIYCEPDVVPGDEISMTVASAIRMTTPVYPVMDNAFAEIAFFAIPKRLLWTHFEEFMGENKTSFWKQPIEYVEPYVQAPAGGWKKGDLADHFGLATNVENVKVSALPFRAYAKVYNDWYWVKQVMNPLNMNSDDTDRQAVRTGDFITDAQYGLTPARKARMHDLFSEALPQPQEGPSITIPLGTEAPVYAGDAGVATPEAAIHGYHGLHFVGPNGTELTGKRNTIMEGGTLKQGATTTESTTSLIYPDNLYADLSTASGATINALRNAFAVQQYYEALARGGDRYIEQIKSMFNVTAPDFRMQRSEFLGSVRLNINMSTVYQTSATNEVSPQGNAAAYSLTTSNDFIFHKGFQEHSVVIGLMYFFHERSYQNRIPKTWTRRKRLDYYFPQFANLGEVGIKKSEIEATGTATDEEIFGYQEAWYEMRMGQLNSVRGAFKSNYAQSLDAWHYGDNYGTNVPNLSAEWMYEGPQEVDRTLAVSSSVEDQMLFNLRIVPEYTRPLPVYSIPGMTRL